MLLLGSPLRVPFVVDNYFVFFPRTWLIESLYFFFRKLYLPIQTRRTSTDRRTKPVDFLTSTVVVFTTFGAIATIFVDLYSVDNHMLLLKSFSIYCFGFINDEFSSVLEIFCVQAIFATTTWATMSKFLKARTVES